MRPGEHADISDLKVIYNGHNTVGEVETLLRESGFSGFPVVAGTNNMLILGFCARRDLE